MNRRKYLPFARPDFDGEEYQEIQEALEAGWVTSGPKTKQFEAEFAAYVGAKHAVAVNSCTAAMHLALEAIGLEAGDEVIVPTMTFAASAEVVRYFNARPVLVDIDPRTLNLAPGGVAAAITPKTKAIIPVHIAGLAVEMEPILTLAEQHDLRIIEDAAHALPTKYNGHMIGANYNSTFRPPSSVSRPVLTCFSFYATKTLTTGEGGMITTDDDAWAERCRVMSLHGISKDAWKRYTAEGSWYYEIIAPGFKYNMTDVAAAMGLAQLRKVERMQQQREVIAQRYTAAFGKYEELQTPANPAEGDQHAWHLYSLRLNLEQLRIDRAQFIEELRKRNISASVHFIPLHMHPYYRQKYNYQPEDFPVAYREYQRLISLPIYSKMSDQDVEDVVEAVGEIVEQFRRYPHRLRGESPTASSPRICPESLC